MIKKPINLTEAKQYDKTEYNKRIKAENDERISKAIEFINEIIGVHFEEIVKATESGTSYANHAGFLLNYPDFDLRTIYDIYKKEGFSVFCYKPNNALYIDLIK